MKKTFVGIIFLFIVSACNSGDKNSTNDTDGKSKFLAEYAEKTDDKNPLVIHSDGTIRYFNQINSNCSLKFDGKIESVKIVDGYYNVNYRYHSFTPTFSTCSASSTLCQLDVADCKTIISNYDRTISRGHSLIFKQGEDSKNIHLLP